MTAFTLLATSCDDGFAEMNVNPAAASNIDVGYKFTSLLLETSANRYVAWRANLIYGSTMIQHFAATAGYWTGDKYTLNEGYSASLMDTYYQGCAKVVQDILNQIDAEEKPAEMKAIARIMRVFIFHRLTDMHGNIPYSEAGKGYSDGILQPKYDAQKDIYADMLKELDEAASALSSGTSGFGSQDFMYNGDQGKWKKFAYSMMLRLGMRMSKVDAAGAESWVKKAIVGGVMTSNDDIAYIIHTTESGLNKNGNGEVFSADGNMRISKTFIDFLTGDPRLDVYAQPGAGGHKGLPNGYSSSTLKEATGEANLDNYSQPNRVSGTGLTGEDDPMFFQTYAEVELLLAEAAERGWGDGDAAGHYNKGVTAAMKYLALYGGTEITDAAITTYLTANPYSSANGLEMIGNQVWAATFLNEYEGYANWRRTGFPTLTPVNYPGNVTNGTIPRRMIYATGEKSRNTANYEAAVAAQGADNLTTRVWWDK